MISIEFPHKNAVFLDHERLINLLYNKNLKSSYKYSLRSEVFNFSPKANLNEHRKQGKKKRVWTELSNETLNFKMIVDSLLGKLKESNIAFSVRSEGIIDRFWEEPNLFPKFKGINLTNEFQVFTNNKVDFIIPPQCRFFNHDVVNLSEISNMLEKYDFVVVDPPWKNKYIRRLKKAKQELGYKMLENKFLGDIPLAEFIHSDSIVVVWCTNSLQHQRTLLEEIFPRWDLTLLHKITWLKLNTNGSLIGDISDEGKKQPYEILFVARHMESIKDFSKYNKTDFILSVPSIIHSHKPPIQHIFQDLLPKHPKSLELFARYLLPGFTSIGLEVIKLMDKRLYTQENCSV